VCLRSDSARRRRGRGGAFDEPTPEASALGAWGGQAVILPYLERRTTMQWMKEVVRHDSE